MDAMEWITQIAGALKQLQELDLGYPLGDNRVHPPADRAELDGLLAEVALDPSSSLVSFFEKCDGASLPDIHVGYFIHRLRIIRQGIRSGEPVRMSGPFESRILVVGSDGGGGRFVLRLNGINDIAYLPAGAVHDATFDGHRTQVTIVADGFMAFLERLLLDVRAFIEDRPGWVYLV